MSRRLSFTDIETVEDVLSALRKRRVSDGGRQLVICAPHQELAAEILHRLQSGESGRRATLLSFHSRGKNAPAARTHCFSAKTPVDQTIKQCRTFLRTHARGSCVFVDLHESFARSISSSKLARFTLSLNNLIVDRHLIGVWCIVSKSITPEIIADIKERSAFFLDIQENKSQYIAQFIAARDYYAPDFFRPRILSLTTKTVRLSRPISDWSSSGEELKDSAGSQYQQTFDNAPEVMLLFELGGDFLKLNKRAKEFLGYDEATLPRFADLISREKQFAVKRELVTLKKKGKATFTLTIQRSNGRRVDVKVSASTVGRKRFVAVCADISELVRINEEKSGIENEYLAFLSSLPYAYAIFANRKLARCNEAFTNLFPWTKEHLLSVAEFFGRRNVDLQKEIAGIVDRSRNGGCIRDREVLIPAPGRKTVATEVSITAIPFSGKTAVYCTFVDVSARKQIRDRATAIEEKFNTLIENALDAISITKDSTFLLVNQAFVKMFGYTSPMEFLGKKMFAVVWGRNARNDVIETEQEVLRENAAPRRYEFSGRLKTGDRIVVETLSSRISFDGQSAVLSYHRDVSGLRRSEEEFLRKVKGWEILDRFIDDVHHPVSVDELYRKGVSAATRGTQFEAGGVLVTHGDILTLLYHTGLSDEVCRKLDSQPLDETFARFFSKTHEPVITTVEAYPAHLPFRALFEQVGYKCIAFLPLVERGTFEGVLILATKRAVTMHEQDRALLSSLGRQLGIAVQIRRGEEAMLVAEQRFAATVETLSEVLYTLRPNGVFAYMSPNIESLTGYKFLDFHQNQNLWRTLLHPDDRPTLSKRITNQSSDKDVFRLEYRLLPKGKAAYIWLSDSIRYERDPAGRLLAIRGILRDSTAEKLLEQTRDSNTARESLLRTQFDILDNLPDGIALFDPELVCLEWNSALASLTGLSHEKSVGKNIHDLAPLDTVVPKLVERVNAGEVIASENVQFQSTLDGTKRDVTVQVFQRRSGNVDRRGVIVLVQESTVLRKLENDIREGEATLRSILDSMKDAMVISDLKGKVWDANQTFSEWTGYGRDEAREFAFPYPWVAEEEQGSFLEWINVLDDEGAPSDRDFLWRHKDGEERTVRLSALLLRNSVSEPNAIMMLARDVTEPRQLALELQWTQKQIRLLNRIIGFANTTMDLAEIFKSIADEVHSLVPYEGISITFLDEDQTLSPWYIAIPSDTGESKQVSYLPVDATVIYDAVRTGSAAMKDGAKSGDEVLSQISIPLYVDDRAFGAVSLISDRQDAFGDDELVFLQPVADHIGAVIQRVRLFEQVKNDSAYIHNLLNSINHIVFTVDANYRVTHVNKAWKEYMVRLKGEEWGSEDRILGESLEAVMPDAVVWGQYKGVMDDLFARRIEYYSRDFEILRNGEGTVYHLVISPMVIHEKVTGLVFTQTDITDISRTEAEIKRRNKELVALNTISTSITKSLDLEEILRVATEQVREIFDASVVAIYLKGESGTLHLTKYRGIADEVASTVEVIEGDQFLEEVFSAARKPVYIAPAVDDANAALDAAQRASRRLNLKSTAFVPLQSKEKLSGAFLIGFLYPHRFSEREEQLLGLLGNQIGGAIENAQLYAEVQRQVQTLTTLYELGSGLTGLLDLNSILQVVYHQVTKAISLDRFYYQAYSAGDNTLTLLSRTVGGVAEFYPAGVKVRSLSDWPNTIYQDVVAYERSYMGSTNPGADDSIMAVPIKVDEKIVGIISVMGSSSALYNHNHLRLLESIANLTGVAIGKAMLYEDTLRKSVEIENRNKDLDDFTYVVSHDLKEPLISIEGYSKIMMKDYQDRLDAEGQEYLGAVVQSTTRMKHLIDDLLTLSRLGRMNEAQETVHVKRILDEILHDFQFSLRERHVVVHVQEHLPSVRFSSTRLSMVFRNLISNAMKFNDKPVPTIDIGFDEDEQDYRFWVRDNGIGIEPQYFDRVFTIFQRLKRSEEYRGTGAGLTIVKKIVERDGGRTWVESVPETGSTFYFTIRKPE